MSTPSQLIPPGSPLEKSARSKSFPYAVALIAALHVVGLGGLLFLGCSKSNQGGRNEATPPLTTEPVTPPPLPDNTSPPGTETPVNTGAPTASNPGAPLNSVGTTPAQAIPPVSNPPATEPSSAAASAGEYKVKKGDTGASIAKAHGVTVKALMDANPGTDWRRLKEKQPLNIPAATAATIPPASTGNGASTGSTAHLVDNADGSLYEVKSGDTLIGISRKYGVSWKAIREINGLRSDSLKPGQKLKIPAKSGGASTTGAGAPAAKSEPAAIPVPANSGGLGTPR